MATKTEHSSSTGKVRCLKCKKGIVCQALNSKKVILLEGGAEEIVPSVKLAVDMHGFVITVPPGEGGERLLDMLWRITMAYAGMPRMLASRPTVRKMVEAVWSKGTRKDEPPRRLVRKSGRADRTQGGELASRSPLAGPSPSPMRETEEKKDLEIARRVMKDNREALHELAAQDTGRKLLDLAGSAAEMEDTPRRKAKSGHRITTEMLREVEGAKLRRAIASPPASRKGSKTETRK